MRKISQTNCNITFIPGAPEAFSLQPGICLFNSRWSGLFYHVISDFGVRTPDQDFQNSHEEHFQSRAGQSAHPATSSGDRKPHGGQVCLGLRVSVPDHPTSRGPLSRLPFPTQPHCCELSGCTRQGSFCFCRLRECKRKSC